MDDFIRKPTGKAEENKVVPLKRRYTPHPKDHSMAIFTVPQSKGAVSSFPVNLSNILYFSRGNRMVEKTAAGKVTRTPYHTIEFTFVNNKEIYWYFSDEADREEEFARLVSL